MTLLDMGGLLPQEEWVTMAKIAENRRRFGWHTHFSKKAHLNKCYSAMALFDLEET